VPTPPARLPYQIDCTDLPSSDQTYGATGELLRVTPSKDAMFNPSYPYPAGEPSMYPPMHYDGVHEPRYAPMPTMHANVPYPPVPYPYQQESYYPHNSMHNLPPRDSVGMFQQYSTIPTTWSNADMPRKLFSVPHESSHSSAKQKPGNGPTKPDEDGAWVDIELDEDPEEDMRRVSQFSYANVTDDGGDWERHEDPAYATTMVHTVRMSDGSRGEVPYYIPELDKLTRVSGFESHVPDVKYGIALIKEALQQKVLVSAYGGEGVRAAEERYNDMPEKRLAALKIRSPDAVQEAADRVAAEVPNMRPDPGRTWLNGYNPHTAFLSLMDKLEVVVVDTREMPKRDLPPQQDLSALVYQVIGPPPKSRSTESPGLAYSETVGSFKTVTFDLKRPDPVYTPRDSQRTAGAEEYEMHELVRHSGVAGKKGRPAMSGQTTLRLLHLGNTNVESSTTSCVPGRRLTNSELARREPNWTMSPETYSSPRTAFDLPDDAPLLRRMDDSYIEAGGRSSGKERRAISVKYFAITALCPVSAVMFGLGKFDARARTISEGRVDGMGTEDKLWALWIAAPLSTIFYAIVIIVVVVVCEVV